MGPLAGEGGPWAPCSGVTAEPRLQHSDRGVYLPLKCIVGKDLLIGAPGDIHPYEDGCVWGPEKYLPNTHKSQESMSVS